MPAGCAVSAPIFVPAPPSSSLHATADFHLSLRCLRTGHLAANKARSGSTAALLRPRGAVCPRTDASSRSFAHSHVESAFPPAAQLVALLPGRRCELGRLRKRWNRRYLRCIVKDEQHSPRPRVLLGTRPLKAGMHPRVLDSDPWVRRVSTRRCSRMSWNHVCLRPAHHLTPFGCILCSLRHPSTLAHPMLTMYVSNSFSPIYFL